MVALHSAALDSITLYTPWTHRAMLHPHVRTATGRVRLTPSRRLSLSPCPLQLHDPCTGREGALHACSQLSVASWWGVEGGHTRASSPETSFGGRRMRPPAHTPCTPTLHSCPHPLSLHPLPPTHSSVSTLQLNSNPPPSAGGGCHRAAQHCTHGLTAPTTSERDTRAGGAVHRCGSGLWE